MWREIKNLGHWKPCQLPGQKADVRLRDWITKNILQWGQKPYSYVSLYMLALSVNAKTIVELGTGVCGGATVLTAVARKTGGKLYTIDQNHPTESENGSFATDMMAPDVKDGFCELIWGNTIEIGKTWNKGKVDFIFMDANHDYFGVMEEFNAWNPHFHSKTIIAVHDTIYKDQPSSIYKACLEYANINNKAIYHLDTDAGLALIVPR